MSQEIEVKSSSGNLFVDLGLANSEELLTKAELVRQISELIMIKQRCGLTPSLLYHPAPTNDPALPA